MKSKTLTTVHEALYNMPSSTLTTLPSYLSSHTPALPPANWAQHRVLTPGLLHSPPLVAGCPSTSLRSLLKGQRNYSRPVTTACALHCAVWACSQRPPLGRPKTMLHGPLISAHLASQALTALFSSVLSFQECLCSKQPGKTKTAFLWSESRHASCPSMKTRPPCTQRSSAWWQSRWALFMSPHGSRDSGDGRKTTRSRGCCRCCATEGSYLTRSLAPLTNIQGTAADYKLQAGSNRRPFMVPEDDLTCWFPLFLFLSPDSSFTDCYILISLYFSKHFYKKYRLTFKNP